MSVEKWLRKRDQKETKKDRGHVSKTKLARWFSIQSCLFPSLTFGFNPQTNIMEELA